MIKQLPELVRENVISQEIADKIAEYYQSKKKQGQNKLFLIFGVLGSLLVGLGIILIIAHNWDHLPKNIKVALAFLPLVVSQIWCGFTLVKKSNNPVWRESASTFLFLSIGACISLVSQIYHLSGDLSTFLLLWMSLTLPVIYLMNSSFASLLYLIGITYYSCESGYWIYSNTEPNYYWLLLLLAIPHYVGLIRRQPDSNFVRFHNIVIALSVIICLGTLAQRNSELMHISYFNAFGILLILEEYTFSTHMKFKEKSFGLIGFAGTMIMLFSTSFDWLWNNIFHKHHTTSFQEIIPLTISTLVVVALLYRCQIKEKGNRLDPIKLTPLFFILVYIIANFNPTIPVILINAAILYLGVNNVVRGLRNNHLGIVNLGLMTITILIICRFFDTDFSFLTRGLVFIAVGLGFFLTNYSMLKNRRNEN